LQTRCKQYVDVAANHQRKDSLTGRCGLFENAGLHNDGPVLPGSVEDRNIINLNTETHFHFL